MASYACPREGRSHQHLGITFHDEFQYSRGRQASPGGSVQRAALKAPAVPLEAVRAPGCNSSCKAGDFPMQCYLTFFGNDPFENIITEPSVDARRFMTAMALVEGRNMAGQIGDARLTCAVAGMSYEQGRDTAVYLLASGVIHLFAGGEKVSIADDRFRLAVNAIFGMEG